MKSIRNLYVVLVAFTVVVSGCLTQKQVQNIVTAANAAMIPQALLEAGSSNTNAWQQPLAQINQLLATLTNTSNRVLSNQLTLRGAILLTVNNQGALATPYWSSIQPSYLVTARDRALYGNHETLVWWYDRVNSAAPFAGPEISRVENGVTTLTTTINRLTNTADADIGVYLGTIRAQLTLKYFNDYTVSNAATATTVANGLSSNLTAYVNVFPATDVAAVRTNGNAKFSSGSPVAAVRNRVWLRQMIGEFGTTAANQGLGEEGAAEDGFYPNIKPAWNPSWVTNYFTP